MTDAAHAVVRSLDGGALPLSSDADLVGVLDDLARAQRLVEAALIETAGEAIRRSHEVTGLARRFGCATPSELLQRVTRVSAATTGRWQRVVAAVLRPLSLVGEPLAPPLPALRRAVLDGEIGVEGGLAIAAPLIALGRRASRDELLAADQALIDSARGVDGPPPPADVLRIQA